MAASGHGWLGGGGGEQPVLRKLTYSHLVGRGCSWSLGIYGYSWVKFAESTRSLKS